MTNEGGCTKLKTDLSLARPSLGSVPYSALAHTARPICTIEIRNDRDEWYGMEETE